MEKVKKAYIAPLLTVVEFRAERGYAISTFEAAQQINMYVDQFMLDEGSMNDGSSDGNLAAGYLGGQENHSNDVSGNWSYANGSWF